MRTEFSSERLRDPATADSESAIRKCVHCGFCTATCPTYVLLGNELDSPRGRIYLIKDMLENERTPSPEMVLHVDRCLSCLSCTTTCPSDVRYDHLIDHARSWIETRYRRPLAERLARIFLAKVLPYPARFRAALALAPLGRPLAGILERISALRPFAAMVALAPRQRLRRSATVVQPPEAGTRGRVILLQGCAEQVLKPEVRLATVRLLNRLGYRAEFIREEGCCGALVRHMGREEDSLAAARRNVDAWAGELDRGAVAIVSTASGCGSTIKDYGHMLRADPDYAALAAKVSRHAMDIGEFLAQADLPEGNGRSLRVAYHAACSLQHGQRKGNIPKTLLEQAGYSVAVPAEAHLCCGSAGTYNILQPDISARLQSRKVNALEALACDVIASGNIGCSIQIGAAAATPVVHFVELLDWATGGPAPASLEHRTHEGVDG